MNSNDTAYLSRSALAEKLGVTLKELTQLMIEAGWLIHLNDKEWQLTNKGEFEGGIYRESKKFGKYIVWPESIVNHPAITGLKESYITATNIGKHYTISARMVNRLLAEMGWIQPFAKGWQLTSLGKTNHGAQHNNEETGIPYVTWPRNIFDHREIKRQMGSYCGDKTYIETVTIQQEDSKHTVFRSLNGGYVQSIDEFRIANWLYLWGFSFSYKRCLYFSNEESLLSDFYLPKEQIHLHFNALDVEPSELSKQLARQDVVKSYGLQAIEISSKDMNALDQFLPKALLKWGVAIH